MGSASKLGFLVSAVGTIIVNTTSSAMYVLHCQSQPLFNTLSVLRSYSVDFGC